MTKKLLLITLLLILLFNCKREKETAWNVDVISPVVKTTLTIDDLIADSNFYVNSDNSVDLDYKFTFSPIKESFFLKIPDTTYATTYGFAFLNPINVPAGFEFVNDPVRNEFDLDNAKINYMKVESGELSYLIESDIAKRTFYTYTILKTNDGNGNLFKRTISVPAGSRSNPTVVSGSFKFDGYSFDLTGPDNNKFNTFEAVIAIKTDYAGDPVLVSNLDSVRIENKLISLKLASVKGYLGQSSFSEGPTENKFSVFDQIISGTLDIDSINIYTEFKNYIGAEAQVKVNQIIATNTKTGNNVNLTHSSIGNTINLNRAIDWGSHIEPYIYRLDYTKENSNIDLVIENLADVMTTQIQAQLNPLGNISSGNDFLYFDNIIDVDFHINLPLKFIANDLILRQKIDLNVDENSNFVNNALISIYAENGFPFDAKILIYLLDEANNITDSIKISDLISSAMIDGDNKVTNPINSVLKYAIPSEKMGILNKNSNIVVDIVFNTNNPNHTTIYKDYYMKLKLVTDMNMEINYK